MGENTIEHNFLRLTIPEGWQDASQVIALGPADAGFQPNLVFSSEPTRPGEDARAFALRQLSELRDVLDYYEVVREGPAVYGANQGYVRHHEFRMEQGSVGQVQFYVVAAGRAHTFTFTDLRTNFPEALKVCEYLLSNARLTLTAVPVLQPVDTFDF